MKNRLLIISLTVILSALIFLIYKSSDSISDSTIEEVEIVGNKYLETSELITVVNPQVIGKSGTQIDLIQIEKDLLANSFVEKVNVSITRSKLIVEIQEKNPAAYYVDRGEVKLLSDDLTVLPLKLNVEKTSVPVVQVVNGDISKAREELSSYFQIIDNNEFDLIRLVVSEVVYNVETKELELVLNQNGLLVKFGRQEVWEDAAGKFLQFWENVVQTGPIDFKTIDLRWKKKVLVS